MTNEQQGNQLKSKQTGVLESNVQKQTNQTYKVRKENVTMIIAGGIGLTALIAGVVAAGTTLIFK